MNWFSSRKKEESESQQPLEFKEEKENIREITLKKKVEDFTLRNWAESKEILKSGLFRQETKEMMICLLAMVPLKVIQELKEEWNYQEKQMVLHHLYRVKSYSLEEKEKWVNEYFKNVRLLKQNQSKT